MKKLLLFSFFGLAASVTSAQNLQFLDQANNNISSTTITVNGTVSDFSLEEYIKVRNNGASNIDVKIKRYETTVISGTKNYFCWALCYSPMNAGANYQYPLPSDNAWNDFVTINAGTTAAYQLIAYYQPYNMAGASTYRYVAFDGNNANDSVYIDVTFNITTLGLNEVSKNSSFSLYPNPANNNVNINFEVSNVSASRQLIVYDVLGNKVAEYNIAGVSGKLMIDLSSLNSGFYFFSLIENNKAVLTKKLMVSH